MQRYAEDSFYLNFDTPALFGFTIEDFRTLDEEIKQSGAHYLFFDEIQVVAGWESYVRSRIDAHNKIVVTGSNASMLSRELGTRMTGRHISHRLMPFSYSELSLDFSALSGFQPFQFFLTIPFSNILVRLSKLGAIHVDPAFLAVPQVIPGPENRIGQHSLWIVTICFPV